MSQVNEPTFSDAAVRELLARAIALETSRGETYTLARVRVIAAEAGIDAAALEQALAVHAPAATTDPLSAVMPRLLGVAHPSPRFRLTPAFRRAISVEMWPVLGLVSVLLLPLVWWGPLARPVALAVPVLSGVLLRIYGWLLRMNAWSFRSRGMVALSGAMAGLLVGAGILMTYVALALLGDPRILSLVTGTFLTTLLVSAVIGALGAQLAVTDAPDMSASIGARVV